MAEGRGGAHQTAQISEIKHFAVEQRIAKRTHTEGLRPRWEETATPQRQSTISKIRTHGIPRKRIYFFILPYAEYSRIKLFLRNISVKFSTMDIFSSFIIYLILYRLAIVAAGVLSIYWGFRLFIRLAEVKTITNEVGKGTDAEIAMGKDIQLKLTNAAPGTVFALFGAAVIIAMIWSGGPSLALEDMKEAAGVSTNIGLDSKAAPESAKTDTVSLAQNLPLETSQKNIVEKRSIQMRGDEFGDAQQKAIADIAQKSSLSRAEWKQAASLLAQRFNKDAWQQYKAGEYAQASFNVSLALSFVPDYYNALDTKAEILMAQGKTQEAKTTLSLAIE
ncbi:MAG: hypothetical protein RIS47_1414, partial [Bacteroidota bacterium]